MPHYFAYGSNLDALDLATFCASLGEAPLKLGGERAWLPDHRPAFHYLSPARGGGALDAMASVGAATPGALFELDERGAALIAMKEGAGERYERRDVVVINDAGDTEKAFTYVVRDEYRQDKLVPPTAHYLEVVRRGYHRFGHSDADLDRIAEGFEPTVDHCFVYGTLMRGQCRDHHLGDTNYVHTSLSGATLHDLGAYPGMRLGGAGEVQGERHQIPDIRSRLPLLDEVEDFFGFKDLLGARPASAYARTLVVVDGVLCWTYVHREAEAGPVIEHGDWRRVR